VLTLHYCAVLVLLVGVVLLLAPKTQFRTTLGIAALTGICEPPARIAGKLTRLGTIAPLLLQQVIANRNEEEAAKHFNPAEGEMVMMVPIHQSTRKIFILFSGMIVGFIVPYIVHTYNEFLPATAVVVSLLPFFLAILIGMASTTTV